MIKRSRNGWILINGCAREVRDGKEGSTGSYMIKSFNETVEILDGLVPRS